MIGSRVFRSSSRLSLSIALEVLKYSGLGLLASAPVLLVPNLVQRMGDYLVPGIVAADLGMVLGAMSVLMAAYAIPVAFLLGLLLTLGRLVADLEILAMRSCGMGAGSLLLPVAAVGALLTLINLFLCVGVEHRAWRKIRSIKYELASQGSMLEAGRFQRFGPRLILAKQRVGDRALRGVVIWDTTSGDRSMLVFAESAELAFDRESGKLHFMLENGDIRMEPTPSDLHEEYRISFSRFDYSFRAGPLKDDRWRYRPSDLSLSSLRKVMADASAGREIEGLRYKAVRYYETQAHKLLALPLTPLLFSFLGVPLGLSGFVRTRARAAFLAIGMFGAYYAVFILGYDAARAGHVPAWLGVWAPNAMVALGSAGLFWAVRRGMR